MGSPSNVLKEQLVNGIQHNEAQRPIDDADLLLSNSTALHSGGQGPRLAADGHCCPENLVSNTHNMSFNTNLDQCQGCTSLSGELHHLRVYFQSEIDSLNKKVSNCPANRQNSSLPHDGVSPDLTELLKEN